MKYAWILAMVVVLAGLLGPHAADSCGPFFTTMLFTTYHGALPGEFESGRVGVLRPHYYRADLLMAYRTLSGVKLSAGETARPLDDGPSPAERMKAWVEARKEIASVPAPGEIDPEKRVPGADFQSFPNCLGPAFENAAATCGSALHNGARRAPTSPSGSAGRIRFSRTAPAARPSPRS